MSGGFMKMLLLASLDGKRDHQMAERKTIELES